MKSLYQLRHPFIVLASVLVVFNGGCGGESYEDRQAREDAALEQNEQERNQKIEELLTTIREQFDPASFPPGLEKDTYLTYQLQQYIAENKERNFLFYGYLQDIYLASGQAFVEFHVPLSDRFHSSTEVARLELSVGQTHVEEIVEYMNQHGEKVTSEYRYRTDPDYLVIATLESLEKARRYESQAVPEGPNEATLTIDEPVHTTGTGRLEALFRVPS